MTLNNNPFANPEYPIREGLKIKDVKADASQPVKKPVSDEKPVIATTSFSLEDIADCYRFSGVNLRGGVYTVDLAKKLLENGARKTQEKWIEYSQKAVKQNGFVVGSAPLYHSLARILCKNKDSVDKMLVDKVKGFLQKTFVETFTMTLSRISYLPKQDDVVKHNIGLADEYSLSGELVGANGYILETAGSSEACELVIKDENLQRVNDVYKWLTGKDTYLWRLNEKPVKLTERVVALGVCYNDRFYLDADGYIDLNWPALGVRVAKNISSGNRGSK